MYSHFASLWVVILSLCGCLVYLFDCFYAKIASLCSLFASLWLGLCLFVVILHVSVVILCLFVIVLHLSHLFQQEILTDTPDEGFLTSCCPWAYAQSGCSVILPGLPRLFSSCLIQLWCIHKRHPCREITITKTSSFLRQDMLHTSIFLSCVTASVKQWKCTVFQKMQQKASRRDLATEEWLPSNIWYKHSNRVRQAGRSDGAGICKDGNKFIYFPLFVFFYFYFSGRIRGHTHIHFCNNNLGVYVTVT